MCFGGFGSRRNPPPPAPPPVQQDVAEPDTPELEIDVDEKGEKKRKKARGTSMLQTSDLSIPTAGRMGGTGT